LGVIDRGFCLDLDATNEFRDFSGRSAALFGELAYLTGCPPPRRADAPATVVSG
jgi:hypothetical protein